MPELRFPDPPLQDDRVLLRPWSEADVPAIVAATQDADIVRFTRVPAGNDAERVRALLLAQEPLRRRGEMLALMRVRRDDGALVGPLTLFGVDAESRSGEIGYWTAREHRRQGLTVGPLRLLLAYALGPLGLQRVQIRADVENAGSRAVIERAGCAYEGTLRSVERRDGVGHDQAVYSLLASEIAAAQVVPASR